jgi:lipoprotein-anchoring transpeptidase ErfK/SrfK
MGVVRVLCAAAAAALVISPAWAEAPAHLAAVEPDSQAVQPAVQSDPAPGAATAPAERGPSDLDGHQASDAALPAAVAAVTPEEMETAEPLEPPEPTLFADINLATQTLTLSDGTGELYQWPISSARGGYRTPTGTFTVNWTSRMHYSRQYDWAPMPYAVFFHEGVAVHGTNAIGNLGRPASHGCVRLHPKNAKIFYNLVHRHGERLTRVVVRGKPPYTPVVAERRRSRYAQPAFQPFFFAYNPPAYQPRSRRRAQRQRYGGGYYGAW